MIQKVNIIGTGNVASYLAHLLSPHDLVVDVCSRNFSHATLFANEYSCSAKEYPYELDKTVQLNIICTSDDAISEVIKDLPKSIPTVHTSGISSIDLLNDFDSYGVLYPFQTISLKRIHEIDDVPFLLEGSSELFTNELEQFVLNNLSRTSQFVSSHQRGKMHLAAVFANNFTNHLLHISSEMLSNVDVDFGIMRKMMLETIEKSFDLTPGKAQTGPAKRGDKKTMLNHVESMDNESWKEIYRIISKSIQSNT
jgi:predicted short-subunit dehydrogenase-like oxidoreductase (DUF2520 family)